MGAVESCFGSWQELNLIRTRRTVLATVSSDTQFREHCDEIPLEIEFRERSYARGLVPDTRSGREGGQPSDREAAASRAVERALRPLMLPGYHYDTMVQVTALAAGGGLDVDVAAINAASAALMTSDIPWLGPAAAVRVAVGPNGEFLVHPTATEAMETVLSVLVVRGRSGVLSLEVRGKEVPEELVARAVEAGFKAGEPLLQAQIQLARDSGASKRRCRLAGADPAAAARVGGLAEPVVLSILQQEGSEGSHAVERQLEAGRQQLLERLKQLGAYRHGDLRVPGSGTCSLSDLGFAWRGAQALALRRLVLGSGGTRLDGRCPEDPRPTSISMAPFGGLHGSCLASQGPTQVFASATVSIPELLPNTPLTGTVVPGSALTVESHEPASARGLVDWRTASRVQRNREELDTASFVEAALAPVLPDQQAFPLGSRVALETLGVDGDLAAIGATAASLAMMDARVPIARPVACTALSLLVERDGASLLAGEVGGFASWESDHPSLQPLMGPDPATSPALLLVDPTTIETRLGDMSMLAAGTSQGLTACRLHAGLPRGLPLRLTREALQLASASLAELHSVAAVALEASPRPDPPSSCRVQLDKDLVGRLIGEQGEQLGGIQRDTGAQILVQDDGEVFLWAPSGASLGHARIRVQAVAGGGIEQGQTVRVKVASVRDFGAFVELPNGHQALLHISELSHERIRAVSDILREGMELDVMCIGKDAKGILKLSRKALLPQLQRRSGATKSVETSKRH